MTGYSSNIADITMKNTNFRQVLFTGSHLQLVVMSLLPNEDIGAEVHEQVDQFFRIEKGQGKAILDGVETALSDDSVVVVPAGTLHNIINTSATEMLKLYTIYSPPQHKDETVHKTKFEAEEAEKHE